MKKRSLADIIKLFLSGIVVILGLIALTGLQDEQLHLSKHWQLFWTGNVCAFAGFFWYVRSLLRHRLSATIILAWTILRTAIAFELARRGAQIVSVLITLPIEAYVVVTLAKIFTQRNRLEEGARR